MKCIREETIFLLFFIALHVHCRTVSTIENANGTDPFLSVKRVVLECDCGPVGTCSLINLVKKCHCPNDYVEKDGKCRAVKNICSSNTCKNGGTCRDSLNEPLRCDCHPPFLGDTCEIVCDCGPNGTCSAVKGKKKCDCQKGTADLNGTCTACDCGPGVTCDFENEQKKCSCPKGTVEKDGICTDICSKEKCVNGECEVMGNGFKCRCNEGFTGLRCEHLTQVKSIKLDIWMGLQLTIALGTFILMSGMFCFLVRNFNKMSKK